MESILDWAAHLKYLQSILLEYDLARAPGKPTILRYFQEGLRLSIRVELKHRDLELESFKQLVKKVVEAEGKASLRPRTITREMDQHCSRGSRPANTTVAKASTPSSSMKDPRVEEPKVQTQEATSPYHPESTETSNKKARKEKKRRHRHEQARRGSVFTSVTGVNASSPSIGARKEPSQVTCYNCHERGHYARNCPEPHRDGSEYYWQSRQPPLRWLGLKNSSWNEFFVFDTRFDSGNMNVGLDSHVGFDRQYGHDSHVGFDSQGGLKGQECPRHGPRRVFGPHRRLLSRLYRGATRAHRHQQSSYWDDLLSHPPALRYYSSTRKTVAFDCASEATITWSWRTGTRCLGLRLYHFGQDVNFDRRRFAFRVGRVYLGRP